jgi:hypothetical protein
MEEMPSCTNNEELAIANYEEKKRPLAVFVFGIISLIIWIGVFSFFLYLSSLGALLNDLPSRVNNSLLFLYGLIMFSPFLLASCLGIVGSFYVLKNKIRVGVGFMVIGVVFIIIGYLVRTVFWR